MIEKALIDIKNGKTPLDTYHSLTSNKYSCIRKTIDGDLSKKTSKNIINMINKADSQAQIEIFCNLFPEMNEKYKDLIALKKSTLPKFKFEPSIQDTKYHNFPKRRFKLQKEIFKKNNQLKELNLSDEVSNK
jgi:hypothetical protein